MSKLLTLALALGLSLPALAQTQILIQPDCRAAFAFTASGQRSFVIDNRQTGCVDWAVTYNNVGFTALDIRLQSANVATGGIPGTWGTFVGTLISGANPSTVTTENSAHIVGYQPFVSVTLFSSIGAGQVQGYMYGCRLPGCGGNTSVTVTGIIDVQGPVAAGTPQTGNPLPGGGTSPGGNAIALALDNNGDTIPAAVSTPNADGLNNTNQGPAGPGATPLYFRTLPYVFDSGTYQRQFACNFHAVTVLAPGTTGRLVLGVAAKTTSICHYHLSDDTAANVTITSGTGTNCGTGTSTIDAYTDVTQFAMDFSPLSPLKATAAADDICYTFSTSVANASFTVIYAQF